MKLIANNNEMVFQEQNIFIEKNEQPCFSAFIKSKRKYEMNSSGKKGITTRELAERLSIDYEQFRKILNMNKPTKRRDCIIAICAALRLDQDETNEALVLYRYMPRLDEENPRDRFLIQILEGQFCNRLSIAEINKRLIRNGYPELDIIDHRSPTISKFESTMAKYKLLHKRVRTIYDEIDQYDSLETEYSPLKYRYIAEMWIADTKEKKTHHLVTETHNTYPAGTYRNYTMIVEGKDSLDTMTYHTPEEAGEFKDFFLEIEAMANYEMKKTLSMLNDTKNYNTRVSAGIYNDAFHVYAETFSYSMPEHNEYYLFEYRNAKSLFSVFSKSEFMRSYLSPDKYSSVFGENTNYLIAQYESTDDIVTKKQPNENISEYILKCRKRAFEELKEQADILISDIKNHKKHIRHLDYIYDDRDRVCEFYGVEKEFKCDYNEDADRMFAGIDAVDFQLEDCGSIRITLEDLYQAFELGFTSINEICRIKKKLGSIEKILES